MIWGSGGSKSKLAKAAGAEPAGQMRDEKVHAVVARSTFGSQNVQNTPGRSGPLLEVAMSKKCMPLWREAHLEVKMYKTPGVRTTLGSCDVEKVHAVVARSTFPSQNVQNTRGSDHSWKLRCRKSARRCGAKHISKSKCTKHIRCGPLSALEMLKKCTPLWREAHFEVKMYKAHHSRTTFGGSDVEKVYAVVARRTFRSQNAQNTRGIFGVSDVEKVYAVVARSTLRSHTTLQYITPVHSTTLNDATPHYITLNDTATQIDR